MRQKPADRNQRSEARGRGFALLIAIIMIALVGTASVALMTLLRDEAGRTAPAADDAQLRQLLIAGGMAAPQMLPSLTDAASQAAAPAREIALPPDLAQRPASLTLRSERGPGGVSWLVHIEARLEDGATSQTIHFVRTARGWSAAQAKIDRDEPPVETRVMPAGD